MHKKLLIGICLLIHNFIYASAPRFDELYSFTDGYKEVVFEITSQELNESIGAKLHLQETPKIKAIISWKPQKTNILIKCTVELPLQLKLKLKQIFEQKSFIVLKANFGDWINSYNFVSDIAGVYLYKKEVELEGEYKLEFKKDKNRYLINETRPDQSIETIYYFYSPKWSLGKDVITKVTKSIHSGARKSNLDATLTFGKLKSKIWVPHILELNTKQKIDLENSESINRTIKEIFKFSNFSFK